MTHPIPEAALDDRLAIVGTAGSGKTYLTIGCIARLLERNARVISVDPLGVQWGLRLALDGKTPSPYDIVIFGGPHGDLPINEHGGAIIGEAVAGMRESCILDLSQLGTKAAERRFMLAFLTALYKHANKEPVHLIFDEADMWAPQRLLDKDGEAAKLLGMMETIVRRGRVRGFIPWLVTQRPAVLSKDVLSQADGLIALKLTAKQDHDALGGWIEATADRGQWQAIKSGLATKTRGQGVMWIPARDVLIEATFPANKTFDSSGTPKRGEKRAATTLKPLDLGKLKDLLAGVEAETKASDPKALKAEIARLTKELAAKPKVEMAVDVAALAAAEQRGMEAGRKVGWDQAMASVHAALANVRTPEGAFPLQLQWNDNAQAPRPRHTPISSTMTPISSSEVRVARPREENTPSSSGGSDLPQGERAVLICVVQFGEAERDQISVITGYKRSSRDAYIQRLAGKNLVRIDGKKIVPTLGAAAVLGNDYQPLPVGPELRAYWENRLPEGERRILSALTDAYPNAVQRANLDAATGYKRSSRDAYIQRLRLKRLVVVNGSSVTASETLF